MTVLANLAANKKNRTAIEQEGGIPILSTIMVDGSEAAKKESARALGNLAITPKNQNIIAENGAIQVLIAQLSNPVIQLNAAGALHYLMNNNPQIQSMFVKENGITHLLTMLRNGNNATKARAAAVLHVAVNSNPLHQGAAAASIPTLVEQITNEDDTVKINAMKALAALTHMHDFNRATIGNTTAIPLVVQCLKDNKTAREAATIALGCFAGTANNNAIISAGALPLCIQAAMDGTTTEKTSAVNTLDLILRTKLDPASRQLPFTPSSKCLEKQYMDLLVSKPELVDNLMETSAKYEPGAETILSFLACISLLGVKIPPKHIKALTDMINSVMCKGIIATILLHIFYNYPGAETLHQIKDGFNGLAILSVSEDRAMRQIASILTAQLLAHDSAGLVPISANIPALLSLVQVQDEKLSNLGLEAMWSLLELDSTFEAKVMVGWEVGKFAQRVISGSRNENEEIANVSLSLMRILAFEHGNTFAHEGGVQALLETIMERPSLCSVAVQALWAMLTGDGHEGRNYFVKEGGIDLLVELIGRDTTNSQVRMYAEQLLYILRSGL